MALSRTMLTISSWAVLNGSAHLPGPYQTWKTARRSISSLMPMSRPKTLSRMDRSHLGFTEPNQPTDANKDARVTGGSGPYAVMPNPADGSVWYTIGVFAGRGGVLRFGKLTMTDSDMILIDMNPRDPFDFSLDHYNDQLVAGYTKNTPEHGLRVFMPDFYTLRKPRSKTPAKAQRAQGSQSQ